MGRSYRRKQLDRVGTKKRLRRRRQLKTQRILDLADKDEYVFTMQADERFTKSTLIADSGASTHMGNALRSKLVWKAFEC